MIRWLIHWLAACLALVFTIHWVSPIYGGDGSLTVIYDDAAYLVLIISIIIATISSLGSNFLTMLYPKITMSLSITISVGVSIGLSILLITIIMSITSQ